MEWIDKRRMEKKIKIKFWAQKDVETDTVYINEIFMIIIIIIN